MAHTHGPTTTGRLALSSLIFGLNFLVQGMGGLWTGSLGLVSDSLENLNDTVVNLLSLGSIRVANRREPCEQWNYGWHRLEIFNTLLGVLLLAVLAGRRAVRSLGPGPEPSSHPSRVGHRIFGSGPPAQPSRDSSPRALPGYAPATGPEPGGAPTCMPLATAWQMWP